MTPIQPFDERLKLVDPDALGADVFAEVTRSSPAISNAPRYYNGSLHRPLNAKAIGPLQSNAINPTIVTPYSVGGGYLGNHLAEQNALVLNAKNVKDGITPADLVYCSDGIKDLEPFEKALGALGINVDEKTYAVIYMKIWDEFSKEGNEVYPYYLEQMKLICKSAMNQFPSQVHAYCVEQPFLIIDAMWRFYNFQRAKYNPNNDMYPRELSGMIGGDGDYEREQLCFGILVEDADAGVYRIWSRVALSTK